MLPIVHIPWGSGDLQAAIYHTDKVFCYFFIVKLITSAWIGSDRGVTPRLIKKVKFSRYRPGCGPQGG